MCSNMSCERGPTRRIKGNTRTRRDQWGGGQLHINNNTTTTTTMPWNEDNPASDVPSVFLKPRGRAR